MATARRTGTGESISTYGSGQTYTALGTWESDTDNDNVTGNVSPVLACLAAQYDDTVVMSGSTNDATRFRIIRPQASNFHTGVRGTGVRFYRTAAANVLTLSESNSHIQDVVARVQCNSGSNFGVFVSSTTGTLKFFVGCIAANGTNVGAGGVDGFSGNTNSQSARCIDCLGDNCDGSQFVNSNTHTLIMYNCTAIGGVFGFVRNAGTMTCKNCLAHGSSSADFSGTITKTNCASEDATADGTGARASQTFTFVNAGANNYHLSTADGGAKDFGTDLSADATFAFDDDIDRALFVTWDIGFDSVDTVTDSQEWFGEFPAERGRSPIWVAY